MADPISPARPGRVRLAFTPGSLEPDPDGDPVVAAINAGPAWIVTITDAKTKEPLGSYDIWYPYDLPCRDAVRLLAPRPEVMSNPAMILHVRGMVEQFMPELPEALMERLSPTQLYEMAARAWRRPWEDAPKNPPEGSAETEALPSGAS